MNEKSLRVMNTTPVRPAKSVTVMPMARGRMLASPSGPTLWTMAMAMMGTNSTDSATVYRPSPAYCMPRDVSDNAHLLASMLTPTNAPMKSSQPKRKLMRAESIHCASGV